MRHLLHEGDRSILTSLGQSDSEDDRMIAVILSEEYAKIDNTVGSQVSNFPPAPVSHILIYSLLLFDM